MSILWSLLAGLAVGGFFAALRLVPPAPATWAGVVGIAGILVGWQLIGAIR